MSQFVRILVLEDNPIDVLKIEMMLSDATGKQPYRLVGIYTSLPPLLEFLQNGDVDIVLSDIFIDSTPVGIELLQILNKKHIPVILMTSSHDKTLYTTAQQKKPVHYLIKPFHNLTLQSTIEKALFEHKQSKQYNLLDQKYLFLSGLGGQKEQVWFDEIIYLSSDLNNCFIYSSKKKYITKKSLSKLLNEDLGDGFLRIHQQYVINKLHIISIKQDNVVVTGDIALPIGKSFRKALLEYTKH